MVDWECGGRDAGTLSRLLERVERWKPRLYCTDDWAAYGELIPQGRLFVGDRENNRIQIFDQDGKFLEEWKQFSRISGLYIDAKDTLYAIDSESDDNYNPDGARGSVSGARAPGKSGTSCRSTFRPGHQEWAATDRWEKA